MPSLGAQQQQPPSSLEPVSIASQGNSENERDMGEEEVVLRPVEGEVQTRETRSMQEVLGSGSARSSVDGDKSDYKR